MRKQFDIKYRPQIESGEYKVETRDGSPVRIICWDANSYTPIVFLATEHDDLDDRDKEYQYSCNNFGRCFSGNSPLDLFIITPEPEMTVFEKKVYAYCDGETVGEELIKRIAKELLALAREQLMKDGYVIEKKAFHDAVENISDKHLAEMSVQYSLHCKVKDGTRHAVMNWSEFQKLARKFIDIGKAEALKDLPRWREWGNGAAGNSDGHPIALVSGAGGIRFVSVLGVTGEKYIMLDDLKKLPGFKEDDSHE